MHLRPRCLCVRVRAAAFSRIQARLLLAVDQTERLRCMKRDSFTPSCLWEPEEEAVLEEPRASGTGMSESKQKLPCLIRNLFTVVAHDTCVCQVWIVSSKCVL